MSQLLKAKEIVKSFKLQGRVLKKVSVDLQKGEFVALMGPSGSGKSTLLNIVSTVDKPDSGVVSFGGKQVQGLQERELSKFRNQNLGIIFQSYHLLENLRAWENVSVPMYVSQDVKNIKDRSIALLDKVGLKGKENSLPGQLSGGEKQRVAIARALANNPQLLIADEPTGNLDSLTGSKIIDLFLQLRKEYQLTLLVATHDATIASKADRVLHLVDGRITDDT